MTLRRTPLKRISTKKARELKEYTRLRAEFMASRPVCEVWLKENGWEWQGDGSYLHAVEPVRVWPNDLFHRGAPRSEECHHVFGRGKYYLDTSTWLAVSAEAHRRIHDRPGQARAKGWLK